MATSNDEEMKNDSKEDVISDQSKGQIDLPVDKDNIWYQRYHHQFTINEQLSDQLKQLNEELKLLQSQHKKNVDSKGIDELYLKEIELRHLLEKLKRERTLLSWELHSEEWRLNKESINHQRVEDNILEIQTKSNDTVRKLMDARQLSRDIMQPHPFNKVRINV